MVGSVLVWHHTLRISLALSLPTEPAYRTGRQACQVQSETDTLPRNKYSSHLV